MILEMNMSVSVRNNNDNNNITSNGNKRVERKNDAIKKHNEMEQPNNCESIINSTKYTHTHTYSYLMREFRNFISFSPRIIICYLLNRFFCGVVRLLSFMVLLLLLLWLLLLPNFDLSFPSRYRRCVLFCSAAGFFFTVLVFFLKFSV